MLQPTWDTLHSVELRIRAETRVADRWVRTAKHVERIPMHELGRRAEEPVVRRERDERFQYSNPSRDRAASPASTAARPELCSDRLEKSAPLRRMSR